MKKSKLFALAALALGGSLFHVGCGSLGSLGGFGKGLLTSGWPAGNRWVGLAFDILNEELFG